MLQEVSLLLIRTEGEKSQKQDRELLGQITRAVERPKSDHLDRDKDSKDPCDDDGNDGVVRYVLICSSPLP
jgi:hypothetical protein